MMTIVLSGPIRWGAAAAMAGRLSADCAGVQTDVVWLPDQDVTPYRGRG